jgi:hypothetical protein
MHYSKKKNLGSKEKNKLECWSILKEKNKIVSKFSIAIMKLNFLVFSISTSKKFQKIGKVFIEGLKKI